MQRRHKAVTVASVVAKGCRSESHVAAAILFTGVKCTAWSRKMISVLNGSASTYMKAGTPLPYYIYTAPRKARSQSRGEIIFLFCSASLGDRRALPALSLLCSCVKEWCPHSLYLERKEKQRGERRVPVLFFCQRTPTLMQYLPPVHCTLYSTASAWPGQAKKFFVTAIFCFPVSRSA